MFDIEEIRSEEELVQYLVWWSPYYKMDRFVVRQVIPSEGGIFQLYYKKNRLLHLIVTDIAFYGGLRNTLREVLDPLSPREIPYKKIVNLEPCYARYSISPSKDVLRNVLHFYTGSETEEKREITVAEKDSMKIWT